MRSTMHLPGIVLAVSAVLTLAACGDGAEPAGNVAEMNALDAETLYEPGNDVSAMEAAANDLQAEAGPPAAAADNMAANEGTSSAKTDTAADAEAEADPVESNITGM